MKKSDFAGFSYVFKFTLRQTLKQKSFIVAFVIMLIVAIGAFPVIAIRQKKDGDSSDSSYVEKLYVINETNISELPIELENKNIHIESVFSGEDYSEEDVNNFYKKD